MADYHTTAVAFGDLKNAALYFDHLVPVYLSVELVIQPEWGALVRGGAGEFLPPGLLQRRGFGERLVEVNQATHHVFCKLAIQRFGFAPQIGGVSEEQYAAIEETAASTYFRFLDDYGLGDLPLASVGEPSMASMLGDADSGGTPLATLASLKVVDASQVPWEQVIEFRREPQARDKLRRLRLFAYENYVDRPRAYIEDDLLTRVTEYEDTAKQWGLETVLGSISIVLNSKLTAGLLAGSLISTMFAQPMTALLAGGVSAVVEVGHIAIELSRQRFAMRKLMRDNPVSFVSYSRTKLRRHHAR